MDLASCKTLLLVGLASCKTLMLVGLASCKKLPLLDLASCKTLLVVELASCKTRTFCSLHPTTSPYKPNQIYNRREGEIGMVGVRKTDQIVDTICSPNHALISNP